MVLGTQLWMREMMRDLSDYIAHVGVSASEPRTSCWCRAFPLSEESVIFHPPSVHHIAGALWLPIAYTEGEASVSLSSCVGADLTPPPRVASASVWKLARTEPASHLAAEASLGA